MSDKLLSKKFILISVLSLICTTYLGLGIIDMVGYTTFVLPLVGGFMVADVAEKFKLDSSDKK